MASKRKLGDEDPQTRVPQGKRVRSGKKSSPVSIPSQATHESSDSVVATTAGTVPKASLLGIPREIRDQIYELVLIKHNIYGERAYDPKTGQEILEGDSEKGSDDSDLDGSCYDSLEDDRSWAYDPFYDQRSYSYDPLAHERFPDPYFDERSYDSDLDERSHNSEDPEREGPEAIDLDTYFSGAYIVINEDLAEPALLRTCGQIRDEATTIFHTQNLFRLELDFDGSLPRSEHWCWSGEVRFNTIMIWRGTPRFELMQRFAHLVWAGRADPPRLEDFENDPFPSSNLAKNTDNEFKALAACTVLAKDLRHLPWKDVETIIKRQNAYKGQVRGREYSPF